MKKAAKKDLEKKPDEASETPVSDEKPIPETKQIMRRYTVVARVGEIPPGVTLELSPAQFASRKHALVDLGEGKYRASQMVQFMAGEEIGLMEVGMSMVHQLAIVEKEEPAAP